MSDELEQQRAELHRSIVERLQVAQKEWERDRWWLDMATEFVVDRLCGDAVLLKKGKDGHWTIACHRLSFRGNKWEWYEPTAECDKFSDRESALAAYLAWKQQQGGQ